MVFDSYRNQLNLFLSHRYMFHTAVLTDNHIYISFMGSDPSKPPKARTQHQQPIQIPHQKFAHFRQIYDQELLEISMEILQEKDVKKWQHQLMSTLNSFEGKQALLLPVRYQYEGKGFCGSTGVLKLLFQNYPYLFSQQLQNRKALSKHFDEQQLWYLLYCLVSAALDFSKLNLKIGDVRPDNIFINQQGHVKIANLFSWPYQQNNFYKTAYQKKTTYLAPQQISILQKGSFDNTTTQHLSQSFSIGLTMLQAGLLFKAKKIYPGEHRFDLRELDTALTQWSQLQFRDEDTQQEWVSYSPQLKNIIRRMCLPDPSIRLSSLKVEQLLRPYGDQILNLRNFNKQNIVLEDQGSPRRIAGQYQQSAVLPVNTRPFQQRGYDAPRQAPLVRSTYTYQPVRRDQSQSPFKGQPQPAEQYSTNPQPVRPVSYNPTSNIPPANYIPSGNVQPASYLSNPVPPASYQPAPSASYLPSSTIPSSIPAASYVPSSNIPPANYYPTQGAVNITQQSAKPSFSLPQNQQYAPQGRHPHLNVINQNQYILPQAVQNGPQGGYYQPIPPVQQVNPYIPSTQGAQLGFRNTQPGFGQPYASPTGLQQPYVPPAPLQASQGNAGAALSNDFLRKLDMQLQKSRQQFPS